MDTESGSQGQRKQVEREEEILTAAVPAAKNSLKAPDFTSSNSTGRSSTFQLRRDLAI